MVLNPFNSHHWVEKTLQNSVLGIGAGGGAALFGEVARTTTRKERTAAFTVMSSFRQIGFIIGPGLNLFLRKLDYQVGPFILDKHTSPGVSSEYNLIFCYLKYLGNDDSDLGCHGVAVFVFLL